MSLLVMAMFMLGAHGASSDRLPVLRGHTLFAVDPESDQRYPTVRVPYRPEGICYQWVVFVEPENRTLTVREVLDLPGPAPNWDTDSDDDDEDETTAVNQEGTRSITQFSDSLDDSEISHEWCVAEGDPLGPYHIRVYVGDREIQQIDFDLVPDSY